jgi:hypothetical protein
MKEIDEWKLVKMLVKEFFEIKEKLKIKNSRESLSSNHKEFISLIEEAEPITPFTP